jgi:hypothetical protein
MPHASCVMPHDSSPQPPATPMSNAPLLSSAIYFPSAEAFGDWLRAHHETASELLVGYWKTATGKPTMTWSASVDEALCYGWIDGIRRSVDAERYTIRFTPRKRGSTWSAVNVKKVQALIAAGRMAPAGLAAWQARDEAKTAIYAYERATAALSPDEVPPCGMAVVRGAAGGIPPARRALGDQREAARDTRPSARHAHRGRGAGATYRAVATGAMSGVRARRGRRPMPDVRARSSCDDAPCVDGHPDAERDDACRGWHARAGRGAAHA